MSKKNNTINETQGTNPTSSEDDFDALLDQFIKNELSDIEEEKENTRIMLNEPEPAPIDNASDEEVADQLDISEQKLYAAYRNYVDAIKAIAQTHGIETPAFHIKAQVLYPKYTPSLGNLISMDVLQGWDVMFEAFPEDIAQIQPNASDEDLLDFAEQHTDENLQLSVVSYVEILFEIEGCEIEYEKRILDFERHKIEQEIMEEHKRRAEHARRYIEAIEKKHFPINAEKLITNYFKVATKDPEGSFEALTTNPAIFAPIEVDKIKPKFFGLIKPSTNAGMMYNYKIGQFLKKLKA